MQVDVQQAWQSSLRALPVPLSSLARATATFRTFIDPFDPRPLNSRRTPEVDEAYAVLVQHEGALDGLLKDYLDSTRSSFSLLQSEIHHALSSFDAAPTDQAAFETLLALLHRLGQWIQQFQAPVQVVWPSPTALATFRRTFLSALYSSLPPSFAPALQRFLRFLLSLPSASSSHSSPSSSLSHLISQQYPHFPLALPALVTLLDRFDPLLFGLVYEEIEKRVEGECRGKWGEKRLEEVVRWLNGGAGGKGEAGGGGGVMGWIVGIYEAEQGGGGVGAGGAGGAGGDVKGKGKEREGTPALGGAGSRAEEAKKFLKPTFSRFEYHVHKMVGQLRCTEIYDIILAFPSSQPALEDLKSCLLKTTSLTPLLLSSLSTSLRSRLLHPGSATPTVIDVYVRLVRALRVVDPGGVVMARAAGEVRAYLRSRKDTIHHVVSSLLSSTSDLAAELSSTSSNLSSSNPSSSLAGLGEAARQRALLVSEGKDEAENYSDPKWTPEPVDAPADFRRSRHADILQLLVSIYPTKDLFVKELQVLLAQRLLAIKDYGLEGEIQTLSTLKLRFGDAALQGCDVMLKDLEDSRKLDEAVHERVPDVPLHATIVSRLFWPSFQSQSGTGGLKLPGQVGRAQSLYTASFTSLQPSKKLRWLPQLGTVSLTLTFEDGREVRCEATPVQAGVVECLGERDTWTPSALAEALRLPSSSSSASSGDGAAATARNALYFWHNLGVVRQLSSSSPEAEEEWQLIEHASSHLLQDQAGGGGKEEVHVVEEEQQAVQSVEEKRVEEMRVFWQFIQGMLTNLGALPLSRIHSTLSMLAPGYKGKTTDELTALLETLAGEGVVMKTAKGDWKVVK
ncbi:hypothetical protein JCM8547_001640 [Rhodosporidiobolus lusitaniae]